jgi:hypothetical protein
MTDITDDVIEDAMSILDQIDTAMRCDAVTISKGALRQWHGAIGKLLQRQRERQAVPVPDKPVAWLVGLAYAFTDYGHAVAFAQTNMMSIQPLYAASPADTVKQDDYIEAIARIVAETNNYFEWESLTEGESGYYRYLAGRIVELIQNPSPKPDCPHPIVEELTK